MSKPYPHNQSANFWLSVARAHYDDALDEERPEEQAASAALSQAASAIAEVYLKGGQT